ncbi:UNVERIFIED_CONTAM: 3-oxoacyl-[acyl-carrier protein] reductase/hypothetical protein [Acetivibrio alkalicellulosi]
MSIQNNYTLITGASKGIGKELAIKCAKEKMNLILVARTEDKLKELKGKLEKNTILKWSTLAKWLKNQFKKLFY